MNTSAVDFNSPEKLTDLNAKEKSNQVESERSTKSFKITSTDRLDSEPVLLRTNTDNRAKIEIEVMLLDE